MVPVHDEPAGATGRWPGRIGIIGAGAMGVSLAAILGETLRVTIVARDRDCADRIRRDGAHVSGLITKSSLPDVVPEIAALADAAPLDAVFVATKTTAIETVASELGPVLPALAGTHGTPFVISFQNGIEPGLTLRRLLDHPRVLRMVLNYGAIRSGPNSAEVMLSTPPHYIGGPDATFATEAGAFAGVLRRAGLPTEAVNDIEPTVWKKGILNAATNPVAALTDNTIGEVLDSPARVLLVRLIEEGIRVAKAYGIDLGPDPSDRMWAILETARNHTPSMVGDIRGGRPTEVGQLNRQIVQYGARLGVPTPSHELIAALIDAFDWRVFRRRDPAATRSPHTVGS